MKALVMSDSHGNPDSIRFLCNEAWKRTGRVDSYLHLGDGIAEFLYLEPFFLAHDPEAQMLGVQGNCDSFVYGMPLQQVVMLGGERVFMTHGHIQGVKSGLYGLDDEALAEKCGIALYGHTHEPAMDMYSVLMVNPGSVMDGRVALLEIEGGKPRVQLWHFS